MVRFDGQVYRAEVEGLVGVGDSERLAAEHLLVQLGARASGKSIVGGYQVVLQTMGQAFLTTGKTEQEARSTLRDMIRPLLFLRLFGAGAEQDSKRRP